LTSVVSEFFPEENSSFPQIVGKSHIELRALKGVVKMVVPG
jgi:hypothetical protein